MDNNKFAENLLKADGIDPAKITESERAAFRQMLDAEHKRLKRLSWLHVDRLWLFIIALIGLCFSENLLEKLHIPFSAACFAMGVLILFVTIRYIFPNSKKIMESGRKVSRLEFLVSGKHRGNALVARKDGRRVILWPRVIFISLALWLFICFGSAGVFYLLCQQWDPFSPFTIMYSSGSLMIVILSLREGLNAPLQALVEIKSKPSKPNHRRQIWSKIMKSNITKSAAAACLIAGTLLWILTIGPTSISLADVQQSIASKTWICIKYNDGDEQWCNLKTKQSFYTYKDKLNFYAGMRDHVTGLWTYYHSNWGQQVHEKPFTPRPYPLTAWDYAVNGWNDTGLPTPDKIERFNDKIDDQPVVRFDMYNIGPCGLVSMSRQVWADPETSLPVRIRKYSGPEKFREGDFTFPESGPSSIYDFGVSQELDIVSNWGIIDPEAAEIIDTAKKAWHNLPTEMRVVVNHAQSNTFQVYYRLGNKLRKEYYVPYDYTPVSSSLEVPNDPKELEGWANNNQLNLLEISIFDGNYEYSYRIDDDMREPIEAYMQVEPQSPDWVDVMIPIRNQWPYIDTVGPMKVVHDEPKTPEGCVLLRRDGEDFKADLYLDPKRDYICVKQFQWHKDKDTNEWTENLYFQQERSDLCLLDSEQWYAQTMTDRNGKKVQYEVKLLTDADKQRLAELDEIIGFFDGEKLIKRAMNENAKVTFWAR